MRRIEWSGVVLLIGGALATVGAFLPWGDMFVFGATLTGNGFDSREGFVTCALGVVIGVMGIAILAGSVRQRTARVVSLLCAGVVGLIAAADIISINEGNRELEGLGAAIWIGVGLTITGVAAVVAAIGAVLPATRRVSPPAA